VSVLRGNSESDKKDLIFSTHVTFVRIDEKGKKIPLLK
jgi:hypothetical protein